MNALPDPYLDRVIEIPRREAGSAIYCARRILDDYGEKILADQVTLIHTHIARIRDLLQGLDEQAILVAARQLQHLTLEIATKVEVDEMMERMRDDRGGDGPMGAAVPYPYPSHDGGGISGGALAEEGDE